VVIMAASPSAATLTWGHKVAVTLPCSPQSATVQQFFSRKGASGNFHEHEPCGRRVAGGPYPVLPLHVRVPESAGDMGELTCEPDWTPMLVQSRNNQGQWRQRYCRDLAGRLGGGVMTFVADWFDAKRFDGNTVKTVDRIEEVNVVSMPQKCGNSVSMGCLETGQLEGRRSLWTCCYTMVGEQKSDDASMAGEQKSDDASLIPSSSSETSSQANGFGYCDVHHCASETSGSALVEPLMRQHRPVFVTLQSGLVVVLWLVAVATVGRLDSGLGMASGALGHPSLGWTVMLVNHDCQDYRYEFWRILTYQFAHKSPSHVGINLLLIIILGVPLEGFHGHLRTGFIFNLGVCGGALLHVVCTPHAYPLVGMSAGCYALMAMHLSDLLINWRQTRYRCPKTIFLALLLLPDLWLASTIVLFESGPGSRSLVAHVGGYLSGVLMGVVIGRNLKAKPYKRIVQRVACILLLTFCFSSICWLLQWPPRGILDDASWCWLRKVHNTSLFGTTGWQCVRCSDAACIELWSQQQVMAQTSDAAC